MTEKPVTVFHSPPQIYCSEPGCPCSLPMPPEMFTSVMQAVRITEALAAAGPPLDGELGWCIYCDGPMDAWNVDDHQPDCPWRMAREWVSARKETA